MKIQKKNYFFLVGGRVRGGGRVGGGGGVRVDGNVELMFL